MAENVLLYPQDYSLDSVSIVSTLGQPLEMRHIIQGISYYEDLYSNYVSGYFLINDATGYISSFSFNGNEYLTLKFSKPGYENDKIEKTFRVYKVAQRQMYNEQSENYFIHFCSEENILSEQYKISKSYKNTKISDIVNDIVLQQLKTLPEKFPTANLEETKGVRDIIIPNYKPFEAINWLCTQAISNTTKSEGSPYLFFENSAGYNFKSLQSLFDAPVYNEYKYEPKNVTSTSDPRVVDLVEAKINILSYEPVAVFDFMNMVNSGAFANRLLTIDPLRSRFDNTYFDYKTYFQKAKHLNDFDLLPNTTNRMEQTANTTFDSVYKVVTTNTGEVTYNAYIKKFQPDIKDINIETTVPYRTAQIAHINAIKYKLTIAGDPKMTVGNIINVNIPEVASSDQGKEKDRFYSGKYLVTAVKHTIDVENKFLTFIEVSKESVPTKYVDPDNSLQAWKLIKGR